MARCIVSIRPFFVYPSTMIFDAIRFKSLASILSLIRKGVDIEVKDSNGHTPLLFACFNQAKEIVYFLINNGANAESKCLSDERTVFHYAALYGWTEIVRLLVFLKKGIDLNIRDVNGETAMHLGSKSGRYRIVKFLINRGADIDCKNNEGITPLLYAARYTFNSVFCLLINSEVNIDYLNRLVLYYALRNNWTKAVQFLVTRIPSLNKRLEMEEITLDVTSSGQHLDLVKCLLELSVDGTDANRENEMIIQAALFHASHVGHLEVAKWLLMTGSVPDLNIKLDGYTALHLASKSGHMEIVKYLAEQGADMDVKDCNDDTPLHASSNAGYLETVKYLVEKGANMNVTCCNGYTPLLSAAFNGRKDVVDLLMSSGAEVDALCRRKFTLLHYIAERGWADTAQLLINKGCDLEAVNEEGRTSLAIACFSEHFETAQVLLHAGANWDTVDTDGDSPLSFSTRHGQYLSRFIKLLILHGAYLKPIDYYAIVASSLLVLQDAKFCYQAIINEFNNHDLRELYKLPVSENLPHIERMKIANGSEAAQAIERNVGFEIQTKGHCNILEVSPMALSVISVKSILKYYKENTPKLKNGVKRSAALDSLNNG